MKILYIILFFIPVLLAQPAVPDLKSYATDLTSTLSGEELAQLNNRLKSFEDTTTNQVVVLMISSLDGYPLEYFANETAEKNKIGSKEQDNGALLLIVKNDRDLRIETGYGLEGALPDALANSIIRNVIIPHFKKNDYYAGISAGIDAIIAATAGEYTAPPEDKSGKKSPAISTIIFIIISIIFFFIRGGGRGRRGGSGFVFLPGLGGFSGGSRSSSSGFGGFSGGGFSGGGGSFGGGGSSGSW